MRDYKTEFRDYDDEITPPEGYVDTSWHNDACPSFYNIAHHAVLFIDYKDPEKREFPEMKRYNLIATTEIGAVLDSHLESDLGSTDDMTEMLSLIDRIAQDPVRKHRTEVLRQAKAVGFEPDNEFHQMATVLGRVVRGDFAYFMSGKIDQRTVRIGSKGMTSAFPEMGKVMEFSVAVPDTGAEFDIQASDFASALEAVRARLATTPPTP